MAKQSPATPPAPTVFTRFGAVMARLSILRRTVAWGRQEPIAMLALILVTGGSWLFAELADEVLEGDTRAFDRRLILSMRTAGDPSDPLGPAWFEEVMRDFTALGGLAILLPLAAAAAGFLFLRRRRALALLTLSAVLGGLAITLAMKVGFDRPRPDLVSHGTDVYTRSFPSGHAMMSAITYLVLGVMLARAQAGRWLRIYILTLAVLLMGIVGISRVYLGVHWPTDVLAGWAAGGLWALACWILAFWVEKRGQARRLRQACQAERHP